MKKVTIKEVAAKAGVSIATVSYVVNNTKDIKAETRQKVLDAVKELNYYPSVSARMLKSGKRNTIGFIVPSISSNFFASIIEVIENRLALSGYKLIIANSDNDTQKELEMIKLFTSGLVDGLIIASCHKDYEQLKTVISEIEGFPIVFLERVVNNCPFDSVMIADYNSTFKSMEYLLTNGHKRIGFISGKASLSPHVERLSAYEDALKKYGIGYNTDIVEREDIHAFEAVKRLLSKNCTALVASTNNVTHDTLLYFVNKSIILNKDVALVGFINDDFSSIYMDNMIQVVHPIKEMGIKAVDLLFARMKNAKAPIKNTVLLSNFVKPK